MKHQLTFLNIKFTFWWLFLNRDLMIIDSQKFSNNQTQLVSSHRNLTIDYHRYKFKVIINNYHIFSSIHDDKKWRTSMGKCSPYTDRTCWSASWGSCCAFAQRDMLNTWNDEFIFHYQFPSLLSLKWLTYRDIMFRIKFTVRNVITITTRIIIRIMV